MSAQERFENSGDAKRDYARVLNLFVGRGRHITVEDVCAATGIPCDTFRRWLRAESAPEWHNTIKLMAVLPAEFADMLIRPAGLAGVHRVDGAICPSEALREIAEATAALAEAWADQRIDHTEMPKLRKELGEGLAALAKLLAQLG